MWSKKQHIINETEFRQLFDLCEFVLGRVYCINSHEKLIQFSLKKQSNSRKKIVYACILYEDLARPEWGVKSGVVGLQIS